MPLNTSIQKDQLDYATMNKVFSLLIDFYNQAKNDTLFAARKKVDQPLLIPKNPLSYNEIIINHHKASNNLTFSKKQLILDANDPANKLDQRVALDHQNSPHLDGRILRFDTTSNLSLTDYAHLTSLMYLITQLRVDISFDFLALLSSRPDLKNDLFDITFNINAKFMKKHNQTFHINANDAVAIRIHDAFSDYKKNKMGANKRFFTIDISNQCISFNNLCLIYMFVHQHLPQLLDSATWANGKL